MKAIPQGQPGDALEARVKAFAPVGEATAVVVFVAKFALQRGQNFERLGLL